MNNKFKWIISMLIDKYKRAKKTFSDWVKGERYSFCIRLFEYTINHKLLLYNRIINIVNRAIAPTQFKNGCTEDKRRK